MCLHGVTVGAEQLIFGREGLGDDLTQERPRALLLTLTGPVVVYMINVKRTDICVSARRTLAAVAFQHGSPCFKIAPAGVVASCDLGAI